MLTTSEVLVERDPSVLVTVSMVVMVVGGRVLVVLGGSLDEVSGGFSLSLEDDSLGEGVVLDGAGPWVVEGGGLDVWEGVGLGAGVVDGAGALVVVGRGVFPGEPVPLADGLCLLCKSSPARTTTPSTAAP